MNHILNIKSFFSGLMLVLLLVFVFSPSVGFAEELKVEGGSGITYECVNAECDFKDLIKAVEKVMKFAVQFTLSFSVVVIAYAGYLYMISGANPSKRGEANKMLQKVAIGIFFILASWMIVSLILRALKVETPIQF